MSRRRENYISWDFILFFLYTAIEVISNFSKSKTQETILKKRPFTLNVLALLHQYIVYLINQNIDWKLTSANVWHIPVRQEKCLMTQKRLQHKLLLVEVEVKEGAEGLVTSRGMVDFAEGDAIEDRRRQVGIFGKVRKCKTKEQKVLNYMDFTSPLLTKKS